MNQTTVLSDSQLGEILFRKNNRSGKYIIRIKLHNISVTIPKGGTYKEAERFFKTNRTFVIQKREKMKAEKAALPKQEIPFSNETELRRQANAFLPGALKQLARKHGFTYQSVTIRKSKTRWGSCSSKKTISLSLYLMLLPLHLKEYVLLHELCHTIHMNHSPAFWALLDQCTNGKSHELRKELKNYHPQS
ncbi:MAG: M48 family metallopeptidase [Dysgonamonadaceae bacterium]|jgi:predicted metal-dependent hydrolase|nr:M48 family metallopeptidase [Dysgonamonadaceae bacterium]